MNAEGLLAHYERIADAPGAIVRLRRFILDLAVRGKLVPQDGDEEPASELLKRIAKDKLDQAGLPQGWRRAKIGSILDFQYGKGLKASERLDEGPVPVFGSNGIVGFTDEPLTEHPAIIVGRKGSAGALNLCDGPSWTTDVAYFVEVPSFLDLRFTLNALAALDLDKLGKGVKPGLSRSEAYDQVIEVPPLAEQHRIVAKVDELMGLCDRLEGARSAREEARDRFAAASLNGLTSREPRESQKANSLMLDGFSALTNRPDQIEHVRSIIVDLATSGRLLQSDEVAKTVCMADVLEALQTGPFGSSLHQSDYVLGGTPVINPASLKGGRIIPIAKMAVGAKTLSRLVTFQVRPGDLLMARRGEMGRCAVVGAAEAGWLCGTGSLILRPNSSVISSYLALVIGSPTARSYLQGASVGTTMQNLNQSILLRMPLLLPSISEQHRVVARVDALTTLCDRLETGLETVDVARQRLLTSLLHDALNDTAMAEAA